MNTSKLNLTGINFPTHSIKIRNIFKIPKKTLPNLFLCFNANNQKFKIDIFIEMMHYFYFLLKLDHFHDISNGKSLSKNYYKILYIVFNTKSNNEFDSLIISSQF